MHYASRLKLLVSALCLSAVTHVSAQQSPAVPAISAQSMRGHMHFLASDLLEGRDTPSRGLDLAAEYIASQFQAMGVEPAGTNGYFQIADWNILKKEIRRRPNAAAPAPLPETAAEAPVWVKNVVGIVRGSDPVLRDTYVLVSAHYDHVGMKPNGEGDRIFNGANDDASGTVSVLALAKLFAAMPQKPKRSIVFIAFFGEEKGLVGSRYYGKNPLFPIAKTVAGINIEQVGRTDDSEGPQVSSLGVTGFDFSTVGAIIKQAGEATDVRVWKHPVNSDRYFGASDNKALAEHGIPAHTISVAYGFPDYHGVGDEAHKIDYENMAKVSRTVAVAIAQIANQAEVPKWDENNPNAAKYLETWKRQQAN